MKRLFKIMMSLMLAIAIVPSFVFATDDTEEETTPNVAKIEDTEYTSLSAAVSAASDNQTIILTADSTVSSQIQIEKTITLDLNGFTLTLDNSSSGSNSAARLLYIKSNGDLTVKDSGSDGQIKNTGYSYGIFDVYGSLTIESGSYYDQGSGDGALIRGRNASVVNINGGTFEVAYTNYNNATLTDGELKYSGNDNYFGDFVLNSTYGKVSITGGKYIVGANCWGAIKIAYCDTPVNISDVTIETYDSEGIEISSSIATISDAEITVKNARTTDYTYISTCIATSGGYIDVKNGTYSSASHALYVYSSGGTINVYDGSYTGSKYIAQADTAVTYNNNAYIYIYDGSFDGTLGNGFKTNSSNNLIADIIVYHGEFKNASNLSEFVEDYSVTADETTTTYTSYVSSADSNGNQEVHQIGSEITAVDATCTEEGNIAYYECEMYDDCNTYFTASTDEDGNITYTKVTSVTTDALGHTWGDGVVTTEATCSSEGVMTYTCSVCGATKTETIAIDEDAHSLTKVEYKAPTYTEEGNIEYYVCEYCGKYFIADTDTNGNLTGTFTEIDDVTITKLTASISVEETTEATVYVDEDGTIYYTITSELSTDSNQHISVPLTGDIEAISEIVTSDDDESVVDEVYVDEDGNLVVVPAEGLASGDYEVTVTIYLEDGSSYEVVVTFTIAEDETTSTTDETADEGSESVDTDVIKDEEDDNEDTTTATTSSENKESVDTDTSDNTAMYIYALVGLTAACGAYYVARRREEL